MLVTFSQFLLKDALRSPLYILNPKLVKKEDVVLPRFSVLHYLDSDSEVSFPTRDLYYFNKIPSNKKLPVYNIEDLVTKDETISLHNKTLKRDVTRWLLSNRKEFISFNLLELPNKDTNVVSVINYNTLKGLYNYKTSPIAKYQQFYNLGYTQVNYVKKALEVNPDSYHFMRINIPTYVPTYNSVNIIMKFNKIKYTRVVSNYNLFMLLEVYKWLYSKTRQDSIFKDISDIDSNRIVLEFCYKDNIAYLPLYIIRSIARESELEFGSKITDEKVQKLYILFIQKLQAKVDKILSEDVPDITEDDEDRYKEEERYKEVREEEEDEDIQITPISNLVAPSKAINIPKLKDIELSEDIIEDTDISKDIEAELDAVNNEDIFADSLLKIDEDEVTPAVIDIADITKPKTLETAYNDYIEEAVKFKILTTTEIKAVKKLYEDRKNLKSPYDQTTPIDDYVHIEQKDKVIEEHERRIALKTNLVHDSFKKDNIRGFETKYINKALTKDIASCVKNIENSGIVIKEYSIDTEKSALGEYDVHRLVLKPLKGKESKIYFRLPKINSEGEFYASGIKYRLRKTKQDLPIRKISPTRVALTSNYGKLFIFRTDRKAYSEVRFLPDVIRKMYLEETGITNIKPGNYFNNNIKLPSYYSILSKNFESVETEIYYLSFNLNTTKYEIKQEVRDRLKEENKIPIGYIKSNNNLLVTDMSNDIYNYKTNEKLGNIYDVLNINKDKIPKSYSSINILGSEIPLGIALSYYIGLNGLLAITKVRYTTIESNKQYKEDKGDVILRFNDYKLIVHTDTEEQKLLFSGFLYYRDKIKTLPLSSLNYKDVYLDILEYRDLSLIHLKELNILEELFIDPITKDVLEMIKEPTSFIHLLLKANSLLENFDHPDVNDINHFRIRGYDRVPGMMYKALTESLRDYKFNHSTRAKIELDPYKVWNNIIKDNTKILCEDNNPITDLKEMNAVTITGMDGLNKDAIPAKLRKFHKSDSGYMSESTVDSGDVAVNTYLTPYANLDNIRGIIDTSKNEAKENKAKLFSTSVLLCPFAEHDDMKRVNFISIQNGHTIASEGYRQPLIRTEYEYIVPYQVGSLYCNIAKEDGIVTEKTTKLLIVKYASGKIESYPLGIRYGRLEGSVYSHNLISDLNLNDKFKTGDYLTYNSKFFERDWIDKSKLIMKFSKIVTVALTMTNEVYEDSSAISSKLSKEMSSEIVKEKSFIIDFNKNIFNLLPVGTEVSPNDTLFTITDENTDYKNLSESSIDMLTNLANLSPKAKVYGVIDKYEIRYNGDIADMSPTIKKIASQLNKEIYEETKFTENEVTTGRVTSEYRVEGNNLTLDSLELKVYIKTSIPQGIGDKGVFAHQMKTVNSMVYDYDLKSETGDSIDGLFSFKAILNRQVLSPFLLGTTNRLLRHVGLNATKLYFT